MVTSPIEESKHHNDTQILSDMSDPHAKFEDYNVQSIDRL